MGETFSQLGSQEDENRSILPRDSASHGSSEYFSSCAPCERAANASFVTCPTCQGNKEIPRELEKQLVALIPYGDQRLKPRHTTLKIHVDWLLPVVIGALAMCQGLGLVLFTHWRRSNSPRELFVFLAVLICLVTSSLTIFFLFPRSIDTQPAGLNSSSTVALDETVYINITNILNISNSNYYPITVTQLTTEVLHLSVVVGQVSNSLLLHIGPLASKQIFYAVANRILDENTYKICSWLKIKVHHVLLHIQGTVTYICLSHSEQKVFQSYEYVDCRENTSGPHWLVPHLP